MNNNPLHALCENVKYLPLADAVPIHLRLGLYQYLQHGIIPGSFLSAVLRNDLRQAVLLMSDPTFSDLKAVVLFLENVASAPAFGSTHALQTWHNLGGYAGKPKRVVSQ